MAELDASIRWVISPPFICYYTSLTFYIILKNFHKLVPLVYLPNNSVMFELESIVQQLGLD